MNQRSFTKSPTGGSNLFKRSSISAVVLNYVLNKFLVSALAKDNTYRVKKHLKKTAFSD